MTFRSDSLELCFPKFDASVVTETSAESFKVAPSQSDGRKPRLEKLVRRSILPSLASIHSDWRSDSDLSFISSEEIEEFSRIVVGRDLDPAERFFEQCHARGYSCERLFEALLAPTARRLGEMWSTDRCDFVDVTVGVGRLRLLMDLFSRTPIYSNGNCRRALLISAPDEGHLFGLEMVAMFLKSAGWDCVIETRCLPEENGRTASSTWFALVGITVGRERQLEAAALAIDSVRRRSLNRGIGVMVGGQALSGHPELAARIGGEALAEDGPGAARLAESLLRRQLSAA